MDIEINEMLNEQNRKLFIKKLKLDLDSNSEVTLLTITNIVKIEIAKLLSSLKKIYLKYEIAFDDTLFKDILLEAKKVIISDMETLIEDRKEKINNYTDYDNNLQINKKYINDYGQYIDELQKEEEDNVKLSVSEVASSKIYQEITNRKLFEKEDIQLVVYEQINSIFANDVGKRITDEVKLRNNTLKNMSRETYSYYKDLNNNTVKRAKRKEKTG